MAKHLRVWRLTVVLGAAALLSACGVPDPRIRDTGGLSVFAPARVLVKSGGRIVTVALEDYVLASALAEVTPLGESPATVDRVYEVQAVLARTYAAAHVGRHRA